MNKKNKYKKSNQGKKFQVTLEQIQTGKFLSVSMKEKVVVQPAKESFPVRGEMIISPPRHCLTTHLLIPCDMNF